jgi:hypothetical protein
MPDGSFIILRNHPYPSFGGVRGWLKVEYAKLIQKRKNTMNGYFRITYY